MKKEKNKARNQKFEPQGGLLPLLPLKDMVMLPKSICPVIVGRNISIKAVEYALNNDRMLFISTQKDVAIETPTATDIFAYGTIATILQAVPMANGSFSIMVESLCRARAKLIKNNPAGFMDVEYEVIPTPQQELSIAIEAAWREIVQLYKTYSELSDNTPPNLVTHVKTLQEIDFVVDTIPIHIKNLPFENRQELLELADLKDRMLKLCYFLEKEIDILQTNLRIEGLVQNQVDKNQREYYLNEQMKAIQKELGREDQSEEIGTLRQNAAKAGLTKEALHKVETELKRLEQMPPSSSEAAVSRNYIDWILSLPWKTVSKDTIKITQAESILDKNHAGLKKAKERIIEFVAAKKFSKNLHRSPVICLVGPPGVGKTSLARSIAESMGREFIRISLGGVRDEAEVRGHRRTYIGALPGKIIQAMKKANVLNPVILLDEIDKMSRDMHGDPAAALLEVLDPEQNKNFIDHYLDTGYDLSQVMFIATANMIDHIPYPLYDRLEIVNLSGYSEHEKLAIAKQFLIPKNLQEYDLTEQQFIISDEVILSIIDEYTKEAGVRQLERIIAKLMCKTIKLLLKKPRLKSHTITKELVLEWLGISVNKKTSMSQKKERIGLATGLAWTEVGGDVLEVETSVLTGKGGLTLTGQLGEVMQESAQAAMSYIRARAKDLGLKPSFYSANDIHLHIPEGATPKDGPSAGITICTALVSALTNTPTKPKLAMTGEITLQGRILSIGGLKEKILAAKQHGCPTIIVPQENYDDLQDIKKEMSLDGLDIKYASNMDEVLKIAFMKNPLESKIRPMKKRPAKSTGTKKAKTL